MDEALKNEPKRLDLDNQPKSEGPYKDMGELRRPDDEACGFDILENFERFNQANDIYTRGQWDPRIRSEKVLNWFRGMFTPGLGAKKSDGYTVKDFALRNAGWMSTNIIIQRTRKDDRADGFLDSIEEFAPPYKDKYKVESPQEMADEIKHVCKIFGADAAGITAYDPRWHYTNSFSAKMMVEKEYGIPDDLPNVIVVLTEMSYEAVRSYPSATAGVAVGNGYSHDCNMTLTIASYIQNLGYRAVATVNDTSQGIPYAIQAGLGEYARSGLLIHPEFGPRTRIGRIHTDLPLTHDKPINFGVRDFCEVCNRCSDNCPPGAIPEGPPQEEIISQSNIVGIRKWTVEAEKCFKFWVNQGTECGVCMRICPYNKGRDTALARTYYNLWKKLANSPFRKLALWLDIKLGYGTRLKPKEWWARRRL